jgi:hypothetical protein
MKNFSYKRILIIFRQYVECINKILGMLLILVLLFQQISCNIFTSVGSLPISIKLSRQINFNKSCSVKLLVLTQWLQILGDSKWLWISMATTYENVCGNCVGRVELTFV